MSKSLKIVLIVLIILVIILVSYSAFASPYDSGAKPGEDDDVDDLSTGSTSSYETGSSTGKTTTTTSRLTRTKDYRPTSPDDRTSPFVPQATIDQIARDQLKAINYAFGTNEELLVDSVQGLNGADLIRLYNTFGQVKYSSTLGQTSMFGSKKDLIEILRSELDPSSDRDVLIKLRGIWARAGYII